MIQVCTPTVDDNSQTLSTLPFMSYLGERMALIFTPRKLYEEDSIEFAVYEALLRPTSTYNCAAMNSLRAHVASSPRAPDIPITVQISLIHTHRHTDFVDRNKVFRLVGAGLAGTEFAAVCPYNYRVTDSFGP